MFTSKEYRKIARDKLKGNWGRSVLVSFIAALLGGVSSGSSGAGSSATSAASSEAAAGGNLDGALGAVGGTLAENPMLSAFLVSSGIVLIVIAIALMLIGSAVKLGHCRYYTELVLNNKSNGVGILFSRFDIFFKTVGLGLATGFLVLLWMLLLIIPGFIAIYRYFLAPYLMAENPGISISEALSRSNDLMRGHKWRLFKLHLSFIGWALLSGLTLGIGNLWLVPYTEAATAAFYIDRTGRNIPLPIPPIQ